MVSARRQSFSALRSYARKNPLLEDSATGDALPKTFPRRGGREANVDLRLSVCLKHPVCEDLNLEIRVFEA